MNKRAPSTEPARAALYQQRLRIVTFAACILLGQLGAAWAGTTPVQNRESGVQRDPSLSEKIGLVQDILRSLHIRRDRFVTTGDMVESFPALYYHATRVELEDALTKDERTAGVALGLMIRFYDAYEHNRRLFDAKGVGGVEGHWREFYRSAVKANRQRQLSGMDTMWVLIDGVKAHLTDLARTMRDAIGEKRMSEAELRDLYFDMDPLFRRVSREAAGDIAVARKPARQILALDRLFNFGANYLTILRREAWEAAVSGAPLVARGLVPHLTAGARTERLPTHGVRSQL